MKVNRANEGDYRKSFAYNFGMEIGAKIKEFRKAAGMSQGKLAKAAGVSQAVISDLESGEQQTSRKLPEIAAALGRALVDFDAIYALPPNAAAAPPEDRPPVGDGLVFIAVHEAFTLAEFSDDDSTKIASTIQLIITAHPPVPRGMSREDVIRRLVRWELGEAIRQARPKSHR